MRTILLSDDGISFRSDAVFRFFATAFFPDSQRDIEQAASIMLMEKDEYDRVGRSDYVPSRLSEALSAIFVKKFAQAGLCGSVAMVMCHNSSLGRRDSLNSAAQTISDYAYRIGKVSFPIYENGGQTKTRTAAIPADIADVKKCFRLFQSASHILAALATIGAHEDDKIIFETTHHELARLVQSAAFYQRTLAKMSGAIRWNLIDLATSVPTCARDAAPYLPTQEQLADFYIK